MYEDIREEIEKAFERLKGTQKSDRSGQINANSRLETSNPEEKSISEDQFNYSMSCEVENEVENPVEELHDVQPESEQISQMIDELNEAVSKEKKQISKYDQLNENEQYFDEYPINQTEEYNYPQLFPTRALFELSKSHWKSNSRTSNNSDQSYLRGCKWSPDGTVCLTVVNNNGMYVMPLSHDLYEGEVNTARVIDYLNPIVHIEESGLIYDFCWFPGMNSSYPETSCWLTTKQNGPIQLWDGNDGELRCTYRGYNSVDEVEPALSVCFTEDGSKIIGGYKKSLKTFEVQRPGRDCDTHPTHSPASSLATNESLLAVGSWNTTISLFSINDFGTYKSIGKMYGHSGGITQMKFLSDGTKLVSGARKDNRLLVWDVRFYRKPLNILNRKVETNQRIYFDISSCGKYLVSGGTDGILRVWDSEVYKWDGSMDVTIEDAERLIQRFPIHSDCCNSISIHPSRPILASGSGQYHSLDPLIQFYDDTKDESKPMDIENTICVENSLLFWWIGDINEI